MPFERFSTNASTPLAVTFSGAGRATLSGSGSVENGASGGRFPISGTKYFEATGTFTLNFSAPIAAFGFYGTDVGDGDRTLSLRLTGSDGVTTLRVPNSTGFSGTALYFGFFDTANTYTSISLTGAGSGTDWFGFDDFSIGGTGQITPVPEPASFAVLASGLLGLGMARRRRG